MTSLVITLILTAIIIIVSASILGFDVFTTGLKRAKSEIKNFSKKGVKNNV